MFAGEIRIPGRRSRRRSTRGEQAVDQVRWSNTRAGGHAGCHSTHVAQPRLRRKGRRFPYLPAVAQLSNEGSLLTDRVRLVRVRTYFMCRLSYVRHALITNLTWIDPSRKYPLTRLLTKFQTVLMKEWAVAPVGSWQGAAELFWWGLAVVAVTFASWFDWPGWPCIGCCTIQASVAGRTHLPRAEKPPRAGYINHTGSVDNHPAERAVRLKAPSAINAGSAAVYTADSIATR